MIRNRRLLRYGAELLRYASKARYENPFEPLNTELFIAKRYLFSKKGTNVINVISGISVVGVMIATMAMVVVLSVFNGFSDLVATFFTSSDPQLKVVPVEGKTCAADDPVLV